MVDLRIFVPQTTTGILGVWMSSVQFLTTAAWGIPKPRIQEDKQQIHLRVFSKTGNSKT